MNPRSLFIRTLLPLLLTGGGACLNAQLQFPGKPMGLNNQLKAAEVMYVLPPPDPLEIEAQLELNRMSNSKPLRFALERPVNLSPETHGSWSLQGDIRVWHVHVFSPGAYSLGLVFGKYALQPGVKLFVYDPGQQEVKGAFTSGNNKASGVFPVGHLPGEELLIEMQVPAGMGDYGELELQALSHAFLNTGFKSSTADCASGEFDCSQPCEVDVNCAEGDPWWQVKPSVVRVYTTTYYCTGVLVNNTSYDGTPYIITAQHCLFNQGDADLTVFQFNYESASCFGENGPLDMSLEGAELLERGDSIDFSLLEMAHMPPASYGVYYAGWDRTTNIPPSTTTIHHPNGDVKKVSIDKDPPSIPTKPGDVPYLGLEDYHYYSYWWIKRWEVGSTEGGSSGGPLFDQARRVIGTLSGGVAACGDSIGYNSETNRVIYNSALNRDDYFTQFGMAWDYEEGKGNALKPWLDPIGDDPPNLGGYNPTSSEPVKLETGRRFHVFPNPARDLFHITSKEPVQGNGYYNIVNLSGALLREGQLDGEGRAEIHTSNLAPGLYIVKVGSDAYQEHHKLLVTGQ
jgi:lysyl endopeptidase